MVAMCAVWVIVACEEEPAQPVYICTNGTAAPGTTAERNTEQCVACDAGYHKEGNLCAINTYTCTNGTAVTGVPTVHNTEQCASCDTGYHPEGNLCAINTYTCTKGMAAADGAAGTHNTEQCVSCDADYHKEGNLCAINTYICPNGTVDTGIPTVHNTEQCTACNSGYMARDNRCVSRIADCPASKTATATDITLSQSIGVDSITWTCAIQNAISIVWTSQQIIGSSTAQLVFLRAEAVGHTQSTPSFPNTVATLTGKPASELTSTLTFPVADMRVRTDISSIQITCKTTSTSGPSATIDFCSSP